MTALNHAGNSYAQQLADKSKTPDQHKVAPKIYFHHHNYAKFHFDFGGSQVKTISFARNRYITDDKREQDQLDLVADVPGTFIYTIPDSDVAAAMEQEMKQELVKDVQRTAQAFSAVNNQAFDPNAPIIPIPQQGVTVQHMGGQTPGLQVMNSQAGVAVVGTQNSFSGTQATESMSAQATQLKDQSRAPTAADEAAARLNAMTAEVRNGQ